MRPLNAPSITAAYFRFLGCFFVLMLSIVLVIYAFLTTLRQQAQQLRTYREQYDAVLFTQRSMGQKVDSIYADFALLNTNLVQSDRLIEQRILRKKDELDAQLLRKPSGRRPHEVYNRVTDCVNEMLVLKDSIHNAQKRIAEAQHDLRDCQKGEQQKKK